jgi:hypothetical protein
MIPALRLPLRPRRRGFHQSETFQEGDDGPLVLAQVRQQFLGRLHSGGPYRTKPAGNGKE